MKPSGAPTGPLSAARSAPGTTGVHGPAGPDRIRPGFPPPAPLVTPSVSAGSSSLGAGLLIRVVVGVMAAAIAYFGMQHLLHRGVEIPESIAGVSRMHDAASKQFEAQMQTEADRSDVEAEAGMFGTVEQPEFLVVVVNGSPSETTDELFQSFTGGITEAGALVGGDKSQGELKDASYRCVAASGNGVQVGTCMWRADDHVGFVLDLDGDIKSAEQLTSQVYRALN